MKHTKKILLAVAAILCVLALTACVNQNTTSGKPGTTDENPSNTSGVRPEPTQGGNTEHVCAFGEWTVTTEPTCTQAGEKARVCTCGKQETEAIAALGHGETEIRDAKKATCTAVGYTGDAYCTVCAEKIKSGETIAVLEHDYASIVKEPTCTERGYTTYSCKNCDFSYIGDYVATVEHRYGAWTVVTAATCTTDGLQERVCQCGDKQTEKIAATGHDYASIVTEPTCTERGYTTYSCKNCNSSYVDDYVATVAHTYGDWTVVTAATCTTDGLQERVCQCGDKQTETIPATEHDYSGEGKLTVSADGSTATTETMCANCTSVQKAPYSGEFVREKEAFRFVNGARVDIAEEMLTAAGNTYYVINNQIQINIYVRIENKICFFGADGVKADNVPDGEVTDIKGNTYYVINNQIQINIYIRIENKIYFFGTDGVKADNVPDGEVTDNQGKTYYIINNEIQINVYIRIENNIYYYGKDGVKSSDTLTNEKVTDSKGNTYYIVNNEIQINIYVYYEGHIYYFGADGFMFAGGSMGGYLFGADGALSGAQIFIEIDGTLYEVNGTNAAVHTHQYATAVTAPTCTEDGYTTYTCPCGDSYTGDVTTKLGHNPVTHEAKAPTCVKPGWDAYETCTRCTYSTYVEKPATGRHTYVDGACSECGAKDPDATVTGSEGLKFTLNSDKESYSVSGIGTCTDTDIVIPATYNGKPVTGIVSYAFFNCTGLTSIVIPDSVTSIGDRAFYNCNKLTSIMIPDSTTTIGYAAFMSCSGLTSVTIPDGVTSISDGAFSDCSSLTSITIPDSVTSIGNSAFSACSSLTSITIPDNVTSIGGHAFYGCGSLTSITIPDSVTSIGDWAFYNCSKLTSIEIPDSVMRIGEYAFYNTALYENEDNWKDGALYIGKHLIKAKTSVSGTYSIKLDTKCIAASAFSGCSSLTSVTIPEGVTSISNSAFYKCSSLTSIEIPDSVTSISNSAFSGCSSLTSITIPNNVTSIDQYAFSNCNGLMSITIGSGVTNIGVYAFRNCSKLTSITIPEGVTSISDSAFAGCSGLTSITIPDSVTSIGGSAFSGCSSLTSIEIPDNVTSVGGRAFSSCNSLMSITIGNGVTSIGVYAFSDCSSLTSITISSGMTSVGGGAFSGCRKLMSITFKGTTEEWNAISKGNNWNIDTGFYTIYCTDGEIYK